MVEKIEWNGQLYAIIIKASFSKEGISFFTPNEFSQQLGYMNRPKGYVIAPHVHTILNRNVQLTQEVLFIKSGKVRVDFYDLDKQYLKSTIVEKGDVILLSYGGHGFEMLEKSEIIEVKQGPFYGESDKTHFDTIDKAAIKI